MRIAHNIIALNTNRLLKRNDISVRGSLEKLSSGLRITKAADDSAGLAISEGMRAQIRGLQQAERNIQDGISLIQTAEGALGEIQNIIHRMRELSVQGANGTLSKNDKEAIQSELDQFKLEIQGISTNTQFNSKVLLDGSFELTMDNKVPRGFEWKVDIKYPKQLTSIVATVDGGMIVGGTNEQGAGHHLPNNRSPYLAKFNSDGELQWELNIPKDGEYNIVYDIKQIKGTDEYILTTRSRYEISGVSYNKNIFYKVDGQGNITQKIDRGYDNYSFSINQNEDGTFVETGNIGSDLFIRTFDSSFNATGYKTFDNPAAHFRVGFDVKKTNEGGYILVGQENQPSRYGIVIKLNSDLTVAWEQKVANDSFSSVQETSNGDFMVLGDNLYNFDQNGDVSILNSDVSFTMDTYLESNGYITKMNDGKYLISSGTASQSTSNKLFKVDDNGQSIWNISLEDYKFKLNSSTQLKNGDYVALGEREIIKFTREDYKKENKTLQIQIGANAGESLEVNINSMTTDSLGFQNGIPKITTFAEANSSIEALDIAIVKVSNSRSNLGALQNRLEHASNNVANYQENLTAADSRIRDLDYALAT